ncbi:hypothetical protein [Rubellicoccus peritrichatus]|uniref:Uncharacterized protein n=1 Tax=Rubellicoccus peritrichatus TaxID=3080537 RepID=A0AAQ3LCX2_9BACT|nr:hypothetical protein [Puniceicoccus sp. CR14]WOO43181.1 hypothetical protein RZN69_08750 [Puniceicoccus sp. CR14]
MSLKHWQIIAGIAIVCFIAGTGVGHYWGREKGRSTSEHSLNIHQFEAIASTDEMKSDSGKTSTYQPGNHLDQSIINLIHEANPKSIANKLDSTTNTYSHDLLELLIQYWAEDDPIAAVAYAMEMEPSKGRLDFLAIALGNLARTDLDAALNWVQEIESKDKQDILIASIYSGYAKVDPIGAIQAAEALPYGYGRDLTLSKVVETWAQTDASSVFDWIETQPVDRSLQDLYGIVMVQYMQQEPAEAGHIIEAMVTGSQKTALACQYSHLLAESNIGEALAWAGQLADEKARTQALAEAVNAWLEVDLEGAFQYVLKTNGETQASLLRNVAVQIANEDPVAAANSLHRFPEEARPDAAKEVAIAWATQDPVGVANWITSLYGSPEHQQAINGAVYPMVKHSPDIAFYLAASMDEKSRYGLMRYAARVWHEVDSSAVYEAIEGDPLLTRHEKNRLLSQVVAESNQMDLVLPAVE